MNAAEGHGGGDAGLMDACTGAVATGNRELIMSGPCESLASHLAVFAAERARLNGTIETIPDAWQTNALSTTRQVVTAPVFKNIPIRVTASTLGVKQTSRISVIWSCPCLCCA